MAASRTPAAEAYESSAPPASSTPWREAGFCVVDLELTGLDPEVHEIVSFGTVTVTEGVIRMADSRYRMVRPQRMPESDTVRIHGLRVQDLADAPPLDQVIDELVEALAGRAMVAHSATVEVGFLEPALASVGLKLRNPVIDTAALDVELRRLRREPPLPESTDPRAAGSATGLTRLAQRLDLPVHRPHHADGDALTTAQAFLALATHLEEFGPVTVGSLVRLSGHARAGVRRWIGRP